MRAISAIRCYKTYFWRCVLTILFIANCAYGQAVDKNVFAAIPEPLRAQLTERLKQYVEYQRTQDYEKLYSLFSKTTLERIFKGQSLTEFVEAFRKGDEARTSVRILTFTVTNVEKTTKDGAELYNVYGNAKLCEQGELSEKQIVIGAQFENGNWYFTTLADVLEN